MGDGRSRVLFSAVRKTAHVGWRSLGIVAAVGLAACGGLQPVPVPDASKVLNAPSRFSAQPIQMTRVAQDLLDLFDDAILRVAVQQALKGNLDIQQAAKTLELAGFDVTATAAAAWPGLTGAVNADRSSGAGDSLAPGLDVHWEVDLWGRQANTRRASRADRAAEAARFEAMQASIAAQMMQAWFDAITAKHLLHLERRRLQVLQTSADSTRSTYRSGIGSLDDLSAIERDVALSAAALERHKGQYRETIRAVELLLGQYPDNDLSIPADLPVLPAPPAPGIPLAVMAARPDMQAAWQQVIAANRRIAVSQAELLPQISLTGRLGSVTDDFGALSHGATVWSLASALTVPLFDGGRRKANIQASKSRADQALLTYLQTALRAFSEVEQALDQERFLAQRETYLATAATHARATEETTETRYRAGLVGILNLLDARRSVFDIQGQLLAVRNARLKNRVTLGLVLGKGV